VSPAKPRIELVNAWLPSRGQNRSIMLRFLLALFLASSSLFAETPADWTTSIEPFKIAGNLYYVGSRDLASYLIVTPKENILINSTLESSPPRFATALSSLVSAGRIRRSCSAATLISIMLPARPRSFAKPGRNTG
jgi:hypothetical protein